MGKEKISTGSINFRITASAVAGLFVSFLLLDLTVLVTYSWEELLPLLRAGLSAEQAREFLLSRILTPGWAVIFSVELLLLIAKAVFGSKSVRHKLIPMERVSDMALELGSREDVFDEQRVHLLEDAIERISPSQEDARLQTGDKELVGLELAVNGLIRRMRESYEQQARFVSDASHELRTPIAVIKGYAELLDRWGKKDEKVLEESVEAIKTESEHMSYLVEQLLFLARGDSGRTQLQITEWDLGAMLREVCEESAMIDKAHEYILETEAAVPVKGDLSLLKQTVRIFVDNASKYTPEGGTIRLQASRLGRSVQFSVADDGIGISADALPHLFERFYRADDSRARGTGGSGLGLAIAKWIIDRHGGGVNVVSREGFGTKITVTLPQ